MVFGCPYGTGAWPGDAHGCSGDADVEVRSILGRFKTILSKEVCVHHCWEREGGPGSSCAAMTPICEYPASS